MTYITKKVPLKAGFSLSGLAQLFSIYLHAFLVHVLHDSFDLSSIMLVQEQKLLTTTL